MNGLRKFHVRHSAISLKRSQNIDIYAVEFDGRIHSNPHALEVDAECDPLGKPLDRGAACCLFNLMNHASGGRVNYLMALS